MNFLLPPAITSMRHTATSAARGARCLSSSSSVGGFGGGAKHNGKTLRSQEWFDNPDDPGMTALYIERYLNYGLTREELQSGRPIIGIAQTGSDLAPCNRVHVELASRVRDGVRDAGGVPFEFPCHPIQETGRRPTAALDRNLAYLSLLEVGEATAERAERVLVRVVSRSYDQSWRRSDVFTDE